MTVKKNEKPETAESDLLADMDLPDAPDEFRADGFDEKGCAWQRGLAEVRLDGADTSGPDKALRSVRPYSWAVHLIGGNLHGWRASLQAAQFFRANTMDRIGNLERAGKNASEARAELEGAGRNVAHLTALIKAAETWAGPNNPALHQRRDEAERRHQEMASRIEPYKRARLPIPDSRWEDELYEAERAVTAAGAAWNEGRHRLDKLSAQLSAVTVEACRALAGCLANVEDRLGESVAAILSEEDVGFLMSFPARAPDELLAIHARAVRVSGIMAELGAAHDRGLAQFFSAAGEVAEAIVEGKVGAGRPLTRRDAGGLRDKRHTEEMMNLVT